MASSRTVATATGACFIAAFLLGCIALGTSAWVVRNFEGLSQYGLFEVCEESLYNGERRFSCESRTLSAEWSITAALMVCGLIVLAIATVSTGRALIRRDYLNKAKWQAFFAAIALALASLVFPLGFRVEEVGGEPYRLPEDTSVGYSYILFITCLVCLFIGELFATRIICPINN